MGGSVPDGRAGFGTDRPAMQSRFVTLYRETDRSRGLASAQNEIGFAYECGRGVPEDHDQAAFWYRKAADQGNAEAQFCLAVMHKEGRGVPHDPDQAVSWFRRSADQGNIGAKAALAKLKEQVTPKG